MAAATDDTSIAEMDVLAVEPFYCGSHQYWLDNLRRKSAHHFSLLTQGAGSWKKKMRFSAVELAEQVFSKPDILLCSDMLDLSTFLSLTRKICGEIPVLSYFHENQFAYPWSPYDQNQKKDTKREFALLNLKTAMCSDLVLFNSEYNRRTFLEGAEQLLSSSEVQELSKLQGKSQLLAVGLDLEELESYRREKRADRSKLILWNHRWEEDKNPIVFFDVLRELKKSGEVFRLALLGEAPDVVPESFKMAHEEFRGEIVHFGHLEREKYLELLWQADLLPVTSRQEFFGLSVLEAIYCGASPLLPNRLSYPELFPEEEFQGNFYRSRDELLEKLRSALREEKTTIDRSRWQKKVLEFSLVKVVQEFDEICRRFR